MALTRIANRQIIPGDLYDEAEAVIYTRRKMLDEIMDVAVSVSGGTADFALNLRETQELGEFGLAMRIEGHVLPRDDQEGQW